MRYGLKTSVCRWLRGARLHAKQKSKGQRDAPRPRAMTRPWPLPYIGDALSGLGGAPLAGLPEGACLPLPLPLPPAVGWSW